MQTETDADMTKLGHLKAYPHTWRVKTKDIHIVSDRHVQH